MPEATATGVQGALSRGDNSVTAFVPRLDWTLIDETPTQVSGVFVGDVCWIDITPPLGYEHADFIIPGIPHVALSLNQNIGYGAEGEELVIGDFRDTVRIWCKVISEVMDAPQIALPSDGFTVVVGPANINGVIDSESDVSGTVSKVDPVEGTIESTSEVSGETVVTGAPAQIDGSIDSDSDISGSANNVIPVDGSVDATSDVSGSGTSVAAPAGSLSGNYYMQTNQTLDVGVPSGDTAIATSSADLYKTLTFRMYVANVGTPTTVKRSVLSSVTIGTCPDNTNTPIPLQSANQSFADPAVGAGEIFVLQVAYNNTWTGGNVGRWSLPVGVNPGAQNGLYAKVFVSAPWSEDDGVYWPYFHWGVSNRSLIHFGG